MSPNFGSSWFIFSSRCEELFVSSTPFNTSSNFRSNNNSRRPIHLRDDQILSTLQDRNQLIGPTRVSVGPVRLWQHIVYHIQPATFQQSQSFIEMSVFARP